MWRCSWPCQGDRAAKERTRGEESPEGESWPLQELAQEPSSWKRCEHVPGRGNCGERERGTFQNTPEGQMAGSKAEGELVGSEVT